MDGNYYNNLELKENKSLMMNKKKKMARKMSLVDKLKKQVKESEHMRKHPMFIRRGSGGNLPPGYYDKDNE